jgi:hypothetical protein
MTEQRYAILIGNRTFRPGESGLNPLRCAVSDAEGMAELLKSDVHGPYNVTVLRDQRHTVILQEIFRTLKKASDRDVVIVYYSGHGKLGPDGALYLTAEDTIIEDLPVTSVPIDQVHKYIAQSKSVSVVLILDCCFSGAVDRVFKGGTASEQTQLLLRDFKGSGTYILTACTDIQVAEEKESDRYSVLTKHIIEGISEGWADTDDDGVVTIQELLRYVQQQVPKDGSQRPQGYAFRAEHGELAIAKTGRAPLDEKRNQIRRSIYSAAVEHLIPGAVIRRAIEAIETKSGHAPDERIDRLYKIRTQTQAFIEELYTLAENIPATSVQHSRFGWGASEIQIDLDSLERGQFVLRHCRGVLPTGREFDLPAAG